MKKLFVVGAIAAPVILAACGALNAEFAFGANEGIPKMSDSKTIDIPQDFACGNDIKAGEYTVKTVKDEANNACSFQFHQDVTAIKVEDYSGANGATLKGAKLVKKIEIEVTKFAVKDGTTGTALDLNAAVKDLSIKVFDQVIFTKANLIALPNTQVIAGTALDTVKAKLNAQEAVILPIDAFAVLPLEPRPPAKLTIEYEGQPALVVGAN